MFDLSTLFSKETAGASRRGWLAGERGLGHSIMPSTAATYQNQPKQLVVDTGTRSSPGGTC